MNDKYQEPTLLVVTQIIHEEKGDVLQFSIHYNQLYYIVQFSISIFIRHIVLVFYYGD